MARRTDLTYPSSDGLHTVHAVLWLPEEGEPKAVVQLVHGICEYILRYDPFAQYLTAHGFAVVGNDHLGHGQTARGPEEYGYFTNWWDLVDDVYALRVRMGERFPALPYFLLGHSMGSFVARTYLIDHPGTLTGCILSGTGQEGSATVALGRFLTGLGNPRKVNKLFYALSIGAYNNAFKPVRTSADWICRDEAVVDKYLADPLCSFQTTAGMNHAMMQGLQYISKKENLARMDKDTPVYFFSGDRDPVGAMGKGVRKVEGFFREAGVKDLTVKLYPGGRHEMLNEINKEEVFADVLAWISSHLSLGGTGQRQPRS